MSREHVNLLFLIPMNFKIKNILLTIHRVIIQNVTIFVIVMVVAAWIMMIYDGKVIINLN